MLFCGIGTALLGYLAYVHLAAVGQASCGFGGGVSCDVVNASAYSELFGLPVALLGIFYFLAVFALTRLRRLGGRYNLMAALTLFALVFSVYLSAVEFLVIGAFCLFCESSKAVMLVILICSYIGIRRTEKKVRPGLMAVAFLLGAFLSAVSFLSAGGWPSA